MRGLLIRFVICEQKYDSIDRVASHEARRERYKKGYNCASNNCEHNRNWQFAINRFSQLKQVLYRMSICARDANSSLVFPSTAVYTGLSKLSRVHSFVSPASSYIYMYAQLNCFMRAL